MKTILLAALLFVSFAAPTYASSLANNSGDTVIAKKGKDKGKGKSEPAPKDRDEREGGGEEIDPRSESYEGNDRDDDGGYFDGGGYNDGGGMHGEIFSVPQRSQAPLNVDLKVEDQGDVVVYTTKIQNDVSSEEVCITVSVLVVEKASGDILSSESRETCSLLP